MGNSINSENHALTVLIHGLWMTGLEMSLLAMRLERQGFQTCRFRYSSRRDSVETNATKLAQFICDLSADIVHFVCHSLGGIVLCHMLARDLSQAPSMGRVVLLGSPVNGSSIARRASNWNIARYAAGKSLYPLARGCPPCCEKIQAGMITGSVNIGMGMFFLQGNLPADGLVTCEDTMADWIKEREAVKTNHIGLLFSDRVAALTGRFLRYSTFVMDYDCPELS